MLYIVEKRYSISIAPVRSGSIVNNKEKNILLRGDRYIYFLIYSLESRPLDKKYIIIKMLLLSLAYLRVKCNNDPNV
jgi:hypothetical protein